MLMPCGSREIVVRRVVEMLPYLLKTTMLKGTGRVMQGSYERSTMCKYVQKRALRCALKTLAGGRQSRVDLKLIRVEEAGMLRSNAERFYGIQVDVGQATRARLRPRSTRRIRVHQHT
jgi:hypothetical protein